MSAVRRVAATATDLTCQVVGRRTVVPTARYVLSRARLDYPNDLGTNGESNLKTALSDRQETSAFHVVAPRAGRNSLYPVPGAGETAQESVVTTTLDLYTRQTGVAHFALVKIDAEGHNLAVLHEAHALLAEHRIAVTQFEYNHRWILARFFLRDAFEFLLTLGYRAGKLTTRGVEFYPGWDADLETFVEGNYLACDPEAAALLPAVTWWKSG